MNEGHKPEEFGIGEKKTQEPIENEEKRIVLEEPKEATEVEPLSEGQKEDVVIEEVKEALQEEATEEPREEAIEIAPLSEEHKETKPKRTRKSSK